MKDFINDTQIQDTLDRNLNPDKNRALEIINKAKEMKGLTLDETALLLQCEDRDVISEMFSAARFIKREIYGKRLVLFAPLYISNYCSNNCSYCAFRKDNKELERRALDMNEIAIEVKALEMEGHKRLLMLCGENHKMSSLDYFLEAIETAYSVKTEKGGEIRRINVEIAPLTVKEFKRLKAANIGTYVLFQETYHHNTYREMHPTGPKADFAWRLCAQDNAMQGGINDIGIGALFGLYDYKYEVLGLLTHAQHLDNTYGVGPHTISIPRLEPALNAPVANKPPRPVSDNEFKKLVAIIRIAVPYTGIILSTRETAELRTEVFDLGVSQISAGSRTNPGGYKRGNSDAFRSAQFNLGDSRTLDEVIYDVTIHGHIPSFCTACYRLGRVGQDFMDMAKPGEIKNHCGPNAISTFMEYLMNYGSPKTREAGEKAIEKILADIEIKIAKKANAMLERVKSGERDVLC
ncbi:MAG: [FeFe] hydrogenase H-cluster radical SAM maturase HydG [Deltaproteobacteria bacterium]|nr:[FeFe] hydrogenase H-cluster radical SAM maturase HydG [Deltaproteobacteria bacterium]